MSGLSSLFDALGIILKSEEEVKLLPAVAAAASSLATNPTLLNLQAQGGLLFAQAVAAQPGILQGELGDFAAWLGSNAASTEASAQAALTKAQASLTAAPAPSPAPVVAEALPAFPHS
jgi:hypothetical protein